MKRLGLILALAGLLCATDIFACTTAIVSADASSTGKPMIWKQRDSHNIRNGMAHFKGPVFDFTAVVPVSQKAVKAAFAGINTAGFAIANNLSYNLREDPSDMSTRNGEIMFQALGTCRTLDDFASFLDNRPDSLRSSANFAVIDAYGGAAYFEAEDGGYTRFDVPKGGFLYRTNFSLSGKEGQGSGYARYAAMERIMSKKPGRGYSPGFFMEAGRSFYGGITGKDALRGAGDYIYDHDFIPRATTASSIVIEGVTAADRHDSGMMWFAPGYPPCCYAIPVWVAAGDNLPSCISGDSPANALAGELMQKLHPLTWKGGGKYLDVKMLKSILRAVRKAEKVEMKAVRRMDHSDIAAYNAAVDGRFEAFKNSIENGI